jgi:hypothetical protein
MYIGNEDIEEDIRAAPKAEGGIGPQVTDVADRLIREVRWDGSQSGRACSTEKREDVPGMCNSHSI